MREIKSSNQIKSEQLGMPYGTAYNKLRKSIIFMLVEKAGLNKCYRCGEPMTVDNVSIEHIENWLHSENPIELFYDLNNISFSHHKCNVSHARQVETRPKSDANGKIKLKGVSHYKGSKPYRACITINGKQVWLGSFSTEEEAGRAYDKKAKEIHGDKARTNESLGLL